MKEIIHKQKISNLIRNFVNKLARNNIFSKAVQIENINGQKDKFEWLNASGIQIN